MKLLDILKEPKAADIPYCRIPAPFRGKLFTRKRKMDAYASAMYAQALQKKGFNLNNPAALLTGRGLLPTNPNIKEALGTQAPTMNNEYSNTPQLQGLQNFGGSQPGSEKLIYEPEINVQSIYESVMEVKIPAQSRNPGVGDENIFLNIPQQAPAYMDRRTLAFEFDIQVFQNNLPINNTLVPAVVWSNYISFVNNLVPSLFKNINFQINNQNLTLDSGNHAFVDHLDILLNSEQTRESNGSLMDQLFIFEKSGTLSNQRIVPGAVPTGPNAKALHFFKTLMQGEKIKVRFTPNHPFTNNDTLFSMANSINITLTRNEPKFYVWVADQSYFNGQTRGERLANRDLATAVARTLKISITNFQCRFYKYELNPKITLEYIQIFTVDHPDRFLFNHQQIRTIAINHTSQTCQLPSNFDAIPDLIVVTLRDKEAIIGTYETNPFEMYPIPTSNGRKFKLDIKINGQNWRADPLDSNAENWYRITNSIFAKMVNPLIHRHTQIDNDTRPPDTLSVGQGTTGYPSYAFTLTFMGKGSDGTTYENRRNGRMELFCELDPGAHWPNNYTWMVDAFS